MADPSFFNIVRHGSIDDLQALLDSRSFNEQELRAALENLIDEIRTTKRRLDDLEARNELRFV